MAITTGDQLVAAMAAAPLYAWYKNNPANIVAYTLSSLWLTGGSPVNGAAPGAAATCTSATTGAVPYTNPTAPALTYLGYYTLSINGTTQAAIVVLQDRLSHMGGLSGTSVAVQTVNLTVPANRLASSDLTNIEWWVEGYTDLGATPQTLTVTYVNTASATHTVAVSIPATMRSGRLIKIVPTTSGDVIQSITSCQLGGSTGTAGNFGFTNSRRIAQAATTYATVIDLEDIVTTGLSQIADNSCLWFSTMVSAASTPPTGLLKLVQG
jgi:hypothetical protein